MQKVKNNNLDAIEFFNTPKKVYKALGKIFSDEEVGFFIGKSKEGYVLFDDCLKAQLVAPSVYKCFVGILYDNYGIGKQNSLPAWMLTEEQKEYEREGIMDNVDNTIGNTSSIGKILDQGGLLHFDSTNGSSNFAVNMPKPYGFIDNLVVRDSNFSDGVNQLNSVLGAIYQPQFNEQ